jgi:lysophospholipase L1-like esterase
LSPADYFGRALVAGISDQNVKVGVIVVAVSGAKIEAFEKGSGAGSYFNTQHGWIKQIAALYGNSPYQRLVDMAKEAQKTGVIKGIIMHQGESGVVSGSWAQKVKGIYDDLLSDLGLPENSIPFLAGQPYGNGQNNANTINKLCSTLNANIAGSAGKKVCHVISSNGCESGGDNLHFSYEGYKTLGERYGAKMLELLY